MSGSQSEVHNDLPTVGVYASGEMFRDQASIANIGDEAYEIIDTYFEKKKVSRPSLKANGQPLPSKPTPKRRRRKPSWRFCSCF